MLQQVYLVDAGFLDAELLVRSEREYGLDLLGPTRPDVKWQAKEGRGFDARQVRINWLHKQATCPEGHTSIQWTLRSPRRLITVRPKDHDKTLRERREQTTEYAHAYAQHAGIEGSLSQGVQALRAVP